MDKLVALLEKRKICSSNVTDPHSISVTDLLKSAAFTNQHVYVQLLSKFIRYFSQLFKAIGLLYCQWMQAVLNRPYLVMTLNV